MQKLICNFIDKCEDVLASIIFYGYFIGFMLMAGGRSLMNLALKYYILIPVIIYSIIKLLRIRRK